MKHNHIEHLTSYCDGSSCHQSGLIGIGGLLHNALSPDTPIKSFSIPAGSGDSYTAELKALYCTLLHAREYTPSRLEIYMDNSSIVMAINGFLYKGRQLYGPLLQTALQIGHIKEGGCTISLRHIKRFQNNAADKLAKRALTQARNTLN